MLVAMASKPLVSPFARPQDINMGPSLPECIFYYAAGALVLSLGVTIAIVEIVAPGLAVRWRQRLQTHRFFNRCRNWARRSTESSASTSRIAVRPSETCARLECSSFSP